MKSEYVYLIENSATKSLKIGYSNNPTKRFKALQTGSSTPLKLLATIKGDRHKETELHHQFKHLRLGGEWFRYDKRIIKAFKKRIPFWKYVVLWMVIPPIIVLSIIAMGRTVIPN